MNKKKMRYAILKELDKGNANLTEETFGVSSDEFFDQVTFLDREGFISKPMYASDIVYSMSMVKITEKGENYLQNNSALAKTYKAAKEIKSWMSI